MFAILFFSLREITDMVWPLAAICGLGLLIVALIEKKYEHDLEEAYKFMRRAAFTFLLGFFVLWLKWRRFIQ